MPLGRPTRRQAVVGLRYVSPLPAASLREALAPVWHWATGGRL